MLNLKFKFHSYKKYLFDLGLKKIRNRNLGIGVEKN